MPSTPQTKLLRVPRANLVLSEAEGSVCPWLDSWEQPVAMRSSYVGCVVRTIFYFSAQLKLLSWGSTPRADQIIRSAP